MSSYGLRDPAMGIELGPRAAAAFASPADWDELLACHTGQAGRMLPGWARWELAASRLAGRPVTLPG